MLTPIAGPRDRVRVKGATAGSGHLTQAAGPGPRIPAAAGPRRQGVTFFLLGGGR
ncbi:MAG: hypothetical protein ACR2MP_27395 [Streptosporangiaceae bacterium]